MKTFKTIFLLSMLSLAAQGYAQVKTQRKVIDNISYVSLEDLSPLYSSVGWDNKVFIIKRAADNNEFRLNTQTGELVWNSQVIGVLPNSGKIDIENKIFPVNVMETLTGTNAVLDKDFVTFNYDTKLQNNNNWTLFVNDSLVSGNIRSVGNVLLLPIETIANKLGSTVEFLNGIILYRRLQDGARIELNINTGIVKVNERIQGSVGNLFYIDPVQKIVPLNIVEILAGITVDLDANANRVNLTLDSRIAKTAFGSKLIAEELKGTPFTVQSLGYDVNSDGFTTLKMDMYMSSYNARINYQSGGSVFDKYGRQPSLFNFQWSSYDGSSGTIGDVNLGNRQLSGINVSRIRGIEYNNTTQSGDYNYSLTAGQIVQNYSDIYNQQFSDIKNRTRTYVPLNYGGAAYGLRVYPKNKPYEFGISYLDDPQLGRNWTVASYTYKSSNSKLGDWNYYFNIDGGQLKNKLSQTNEKSGFDFKSAWSANNNWGKTSLTLDGTYSGQLFEQYYQPTLQTIINNNNGIGNNPLSPLLPNIDNTGFSKFSQNATTSYRLTDTLSMSYGINYNARKNDVAQYDYLINNIGISKSFQTGSLSLNNLRGSGDDTTGKYKVNIINGIGQKTFDWVNLMGRIDYDSVSNYKNGQINAQIQPYKSQWDNVSGSLNTSLNYNFSKKDEIKNQTGFLNLNYTLNNSKPINGWNFTGGAGASVKVYENNNNPNYVNVINGQSSYYSDRKVNPFAFLNASYSISKALRFQVSVSYDSYGKARVFAGLSGDIDYAPPRTVSNYVAQKGLLKGKVFIDDNYDGIEQPEETKPIAVQVSIKGTGLALNTTQSGNFTIQNLSPGLYDLSVALDNLPLGWAIDEETNTRFSITPDQITEIKIPIRKVYSITGQVLTKDDEGLVVEILKGDKLLKRSITTFGGQFSFDGLKPDNYTVRLYDSNEKSYSQEAIIKEGSDKKYIFKLPN